MSMYINAACLSDAVLWCGAWHLAAVKAANVE
jgi:hypothetical protein